MLIYLQRKVTIWPRVPVDVAAADADNILVGVAGGIKVEELAGFGALMVTSTRLTVAASAVMGRSPSSITQHRSILNILWIPRLFFMFISHWFSFIYQTP